MVNPIQQVKYHLSHISSQDWHYRMVDRVFHQGYVAQKACSYWWIQFPLALFVWLCTSLAYLMLISGGIFFGFMPRVYDKDTLLKPLNHDSSYLFYPYKTLPNGRKLPIALWQIVVPSLLLWWTILIVQWFFALSGEVKLIIISSIMIALALSGVIFLISNTWTIPFIAGPRSRLAQKLGTLCPPLKVKHPDRE